jgi:rhodanese-related sulfurtransferase
MNKMFDISVIEIKKNQDEYVLIDVREPYELSGSEGFIEGSTLIPLSQGLGSFLLSADPEKKYIFICRSGYRSTQACALAHTQGFQAYNMAGGMIAWREMERSS